MRKVSQKNPVLLEQKKYNAAIVTTLKLQRVMFRKGKVNRNIHAGAYAAKSHISSIPLDIVDTLKRHFNEGETETLDKLLSAPAPTAKPRPPFPYFKDQTQ